MQAAYVKCLYCGEKFNRNSPKIKVKKVNERRYAHFECWEKHLNNMTQEEKDIENFFEYVKNLYKEDYNYLLTKRLAERYVKENKYTYSGMLKTLKWYYEIQNNSIEKAKGTIGIIPYIYNEALKYYYNLYKIQLLNKNKDKYNIQTREIEIESPRVYVRPPHMWLE